MQNKKRKAEEKKSERNKDKIKLNEILLTVYNQKWISFVQPTITLQVEQEKKEIQKKKNTRSNLFEFVHCNFNSRFNEIISILTF